MISLRHLLVCLCCLIHGRVAVAQVVDTVSRGDSAAGIDARYVGERPLRGDEANEEPPLSGYVTGTVRVRYNARGWELGVTVDNALDRVYETFGTFNVNQGAGGTVERFLTPGTPRTVMISARRRLGR